MNAIIKPFGKCINPTVFNNSYKKGINMSQQISKIQALLQSRKFWAALIAAISAASAYALGEISAWQFIQALVAVAASYATGVAIEDAGYHIGSK